MQITQVTPAEYRSLFSTVPHAYNSVEFSTLNSDKVQELCYLKLADSKTRFGIILGLKDDGEYYTPFSAPFGGFTMPKPQRLRYMEEAVELLKSFAARPVHITLPPLVYDTTQLSKWVNVLQRYATAQCIDLNYHFDLSLVPVYEQIVARDARWSLHRAAGSEFAFVPLGDTDDDINRAYAVIRANREEHGYPLRMTLQAVKDTSKILKADFFVMTHEGVDIAAAQVYHVADGIVQVIYWGDLKAYAHLRTMNRFALEIFTHYHRQGVKIIDIGPSSTDGTPNHGLCEFKESIGCAVTPKFQFTI